MDIIEGTIILKILKATLARDTEYFAKMAPYCIMKIGKTKSKTTVKKNFGKTPEWFEVFSIPSKLGDELQLEVWDKDAVGSDDLVGEGTVTIKQDFINMKYCFWVPLKYKKVNGGQLQIDIEFIPNHASFNILMGMLENELKEKQILLNKYEHSPGEINEEILNSKEATSKKIKELNEQINQLKIEFQTKKNEIDNQTLVHKKVREEREKNIAELDKQLENYQKSVIDGILVIRVSDGSFCRDVGTLFDKQDPFAIFSIGSTQAKTKVVNNGGKKVVWNETLELERSSQDELLIEVLDYEEDKKHHCIGYTQISIKECVHSKEKKSFHNTKIYYRGEEAGEVSFEIQFLPK